MVDPSPALGVVVGLLAAPALAVLTTVGLVTRQGLTTAGLPERLPG